MSTSFIGEVRAVGFNFAPVGWLMCQGQLVSIAENSALFQLIGTTYGGDGQSTFGLPNLQSRIPIHQGTGGGATYVIGQAGGLEQVTIGANQYPQHTHSLQATSSTAGSSAPANSVVGSGSKIYGGPTALPVTPLNASMVGPSNGGNGPHGNIQPYLVLNWIISLYGVFPSQS
jgi:microcystin-dependent protein